jgi:hypothetical protein
MTSVTQLAWGNFTPGGRVSDASLGLGRGAVSVLGGSTGRPSNWVDKTMWESPRP